MTAQELFDFVARKLLAQGRPSGVTHEDGQFRCLYRAPDGAKCAAGWLIPDEDYVPQMEGRAIDKVIKEWGEGYPEIAVLDQHWCLLWDLQNAHDVPARLPDWVERWRERMREVAEVYGLDAAVLDAA